MVVYRYFSSSAPRILISTTSRRNEYCFTSLPRDVQKQIAVSKKQKEEADKALAAATRAVDDLQQHLSMAEEGTAELQKQADSMKQQADSEVKKIKLLERQVIFNHTPVIFVLRLFLTNYCRYIANECWQCACFIHVSHIMLPAAGSLWEDACRRGDQAD